METERLILRRYKEEELSDYYEYISKPNVVKYEPYKAMTIEEAKKDLDYRISSDEFIAVELKEIHKLIGNIYMGHREFNSLEIGYVFNDAYWKMGYATEGGKALIEEAFAKGVHRIFGECDPQNENSWRLLERLGFRREALLKKNVYFWTDTEGKPIWKDTYIYALLNSEVRK